MKMQSIPVFFDIAKFADFRQKVVDVSKTPEGCPVIYIFFGSFLDKYNCAKFHHCRICVKDNREGGPFYHPPPPHPWAALKKPYGLKNWIVSKSS